VRALRKSGRFAVVHEDTDTGLRIWTSGVKALRPQKRDGVAGWAVGSKPEARARTTPRWVPDSQVREMWTAHDEDPLSPWTPLFPGDRRSLSNAIKQPCPYPIREPISGRLPVRLDRRVTGRPGQTANERIKP
jgi:hypothetical protein